MLTWSPVFSGWGWDWPEEMFLITMMSRPPQSHHSLGWPRLRFWRFYFSLETIWWRGVVQTVDCGVTRDSSGRTAPPVLAPVWGSRLGDEVVARPEAGSIQETSCWDSPPLLPLLLLLLLRPLDWSWYCCCSQPPSWARVSWWRPLGWSSFAHFSCLEVCCLFCTSSDGSGTKFWSASLINTEREQFLSGGAGWDND